MRGAPALNSEGVNLALIHQLPADLPLRRQGDWVRILDALEVPAHVFIGRGVVQLGHPLGGWRVGVVGKRLAHRRVRELSQSFGRRGVRDVLSEQADPHAGLADRSLHLRIPQGVDQLTDGNTLKLTTVEALLSRVKVLRFRRPPLALQPPHQGVVALGLIGAVVDDVLDGGGRLQLGIS